MKKGDRDSKHPDAADKRHSRKRREVLTGTAAGSGLALLAGGHWRRPVVESVILPVHAQTSSLFSLRDPCNVTVTASSGSNRVELTGLVLGPSGHVGGITGTANLRILNCSHSQSGTDSMPLTTDSGGNYSAVFLSSGGVCSPENCESFIVDVIFPGIGSQTCHDNKGLCT